MTSVKLSCRKCRTPLNDDCVDCLVTVHGQAITANDIHQNRMCFNQPNDAFYMKDNYMPKWIMESVNTAGWCKGKLTCPQCSARVGSFDFVSGLQCMCKNFVLPPVHLVKSKVDYTIN